MWEYEVILFGVGLVILALVAGVIYVVFSNKPDKDVDKERFISNSDSVLCVCDRDRERNSAGNVDEEKIKHLYALAEKIGVTIGGDE